MLQDWQEQLESILDVGAAVGCLGGCKTWVVTDCVRVMFCGELRVGDKEEVGKGGKKVMSEHGRKKVEGRKW